MLDLTRQNEVIFVLAVSAGYCLQFLSKGLYLLIQPRYTIYERQFARLYLGKDWRQMFLINNPEHILATVSGFVLAFAVPALSYLLPWFTPKPEWQSLIGPSVAAGTSFLWAWYLLTGIILFLPRIAHWRGWVSQDGVSQNFDDSMPRRPPKIFLPLAYILGNDIPLYGIALVVNFFLGIILAILSVLPLESRQGTMQNIYGMVWGIFLFIFILMPLVLGLITRLYRKS